MTDFDYENLQKKRTAQGAFHKKGGSKSKRCTMPSDYLTPAQKKKLNGHTHELNLNQPLTWAEYKCIPTDSLKKTYLLNLMNTYKPSAQMLHRMFGCAATTVTAELRRQGLPVGKKGTKKPTKEQNAMWEAFCNGVIGGGDNVQPKEEAPADEPQATCYDVDAEAFERAKAAVDLLCHGVEQMQETTPENEEVPDDYDWREDWDRTLAEPVEPVPDNGVKLHRLPVMKVDNDSITFYEPVSFMSKMESELTGDSRGVAKQVAELLAMFSGKLSVKLSIEVQG